MPNNENKGDSTKNLDDTAYYDELYNDFPEEVKDILMETHPLRGKDLDSDSALYRTRKREISEVEAVKKARSEQIKKELSEDFGVDVKENTVNHSSSKKNSKKKNVNKNKNKIDNNSNKIDSDDYNYERIQTVKIKPSPKTVVQEKPIEAEKKNKKNIKSLKPKSLPKFNKKKSSKKEDIKDFAEPLPNSSIDDLYKISDFQDDEKINLPSKEKFVMVGGLVFIILFVFFAFKTVTLSGKLNKANEEINRMSNVQEQNEELKMKILSLEEQLYGKTGGETSANDNKNESSDVSTGEFDTYTVVEGDNFGSIATKIYGDFSQYTRILEANGLTESSSLQIGQTLKIPR